MKYIMKRLKYIRVPRLNAHQHHKNLINNQLPI